MSTTTQPDRAKVGRAFMLVGALGLVIQLAIYAVTQQSMVALTTAMPFVVFFVIGTALFVHARRGGQPTRGH